MNKVVIAGERQREGEKLRKKKRKKGRRSERREDTRREREFKTENEEGRKVTSKSCWKQVEN